MKALPRIIRPTAALSGSVGPFDIAYEGAGAWAEQLSSGAISTPYPSGIVAGNALALVTITRFDVDTTTPSGWTQQIELSHSAGSNATDSGAVRVGIYTKEAVGTETGNLSVDLASACNVCRARIFRFSKAGGAWSFASFNSVQNPGNPLVFTSLSGILSFQPKDVWLGAIGINGNTCVPNTATVLDMGTGPNENMTTIDNSSSGSGADLAWAVARHTMTTTDTINAVTQACSGTATANTPAAALCFLRLRAA